MAVKYLFQYQGYAHHSNHEKCCVIHEMKGFSTMSQGEKECQDGAFSDRRRGVLSNFVSLYARCE
jgi:hypothetical protein